jgi:hypothetical protein
LPLGVISILYWLFRCRPSLCKVFFEIGSLGLVSLFVGYLELVIGACVWAWGWAIQMAWVTVLNLVGWIGTVIACSVNPNN